MSPRRRLSIDCYYDVKAAGHATPCWIWNGGYTINSCGLRYAKYSIPNGRRNKTVKMSRYMYELYTGKSIPEGMVIDHLCNNTMCVNPEHLEVVTQSVNKKRAYERIDERRRREKIAN